MAIKEVSVEVVKQGDDLAILLPAKFYEDTGLEEGTKIKIAYTKRGHFEVKVELGEGEKAYCQICGKRWGKYTCNMCGLTACSNCFWEFGQLCGNCMKKKK
jgi:hypothetical protein